MKPGTTTPWTVARRDFLKCTGLALAGLSSGAPFARAVGTDQKTRLRFGIVTDAHFADTGARGSRHYRESVAKMAECVALMNDKQVDFLVELGDLKDQGSPASEQDTLTFLETIETVFSQFNGPRYHVLGNHDVDSISKGQFLDRAKNTGIAKDASYYSFDAGGVHFIVLDANYDATGADYDRGNFVWTDTNIPPRELAWLKDDLASSSTPVIVFVHQRLDSAGNTTVRNAAHVRRLLQESNRVLAVFQGHHHPGHHSHIENIHYCTLKAMVEGAGEVNNSYAIVDVYDDHTLAITGYRKAVSRKLSQGGPVPSPN